MGTPFLAEIRMMSFIFAPKGWAMCNGQLMPINQNQALFSLLGTVYGGDGRVTFAIPDLRGRVPVHMGSGFTLGEQMGQEAHTVTISELPAHTHQLMAASDDGASIQATGNLLASTVPQLYRSGSPTVAAQAASLTPLGGSQPHENRQPYIGLNFCIALQGIFPSQT